MFKIKFDQDISLFALFCLYEKLIHWHLI